MGYAFPGRVRFSETGADKKLTLWGILNYFQDCATFHSEDSGVGIGLLAARDRVWVLSSWQICVDRYPDVCENIEVATYPYAFKGLLGMRNFTMKTREGELLAWANSVWSFLEVSTGRPARVEADIRERYGLDERLDMDYASRKVPVPEAGERRDPIVVQREHLDCNGHVNNGKYVQLAADYLPEDFGVGQMRAEYRRQVMLGDVLYPLVEQGDGVCRVALCDGEGKPCEITEFTRKAG
ncbi:MAG TPA: acyl-[acyl-carrier-protein] thioesterase [Lachnospiraceae bacterium]|nr:acyl-[acyl-carrier-protein] thioesterase [Lachnospiraceae bacterium]